MLFTVTLTDILHYYFRDEARIVMLVFIMNYPLGKKLVQHIQFYLTQLSYELDHGRISAIKMMHILIEKFAVVCYLIPNCSFLN